MRPARFSDVAEELMPKGNPVAKIATLLIFQPLVTAEATRLLENQRCPLPNGRSYTVLIVTTCVRLIAWRALYSQY